jgi:D-alanyl-lipoteichoic acid acyltransferase DltB (MBOAT superfamily)
MIDSLSFLMLILVSISLYQIFTNSHNLVRLFWIVLPGSILIYAVHPTALLYAVGCFAFLLIMFITGRSLSSSRAKVRLPYFVLLLLFLPDVFNFAQKHPVLYLGAAFFIVRNMMTLSEALKKGIAFSEYFPAALVATFFIGALPSGPVYSGLDIWNQMKQRKPIDYSEGAYRLFEGFVCLFALAGFINMALNHITSYAFYGSNMLIIIFSGIIYVAIKSLLAFGFLFSTFYGYSRMAEGTALLMGFNIPQNFDNPHLATDLGNFWKRWHRSMANFVMQYIYLPLLVTHKNAKYALIAAFLAMGIWHKFSVGFLLWGLGHGVGLAYIMPWLNKRFSSPTFIRVVSLAYVVFLSSIAHEVWTS